MYQNELWFSVVDVVEAMTDSAKPRYYWYVMKIGEKSEDGVEFFTICRQLKLESRPPIGRISKYLPYNGIPTRFSLNQALNQSKDVCTFVRVFDSDHLLEITK